MKLECVLPEAKIVHQFQANPVNTSMTKIELMAIG